MKSFRKSLALYFLVYYPLIAAMHTNKRALPIHGRRNLIFLLVNFIFT